MRFRSLSQNCGRARHLGVSGSVSMLLGTSLGATVCAGALLVGPMAQPVLAAPTIGGDENGPQVQILQPAYQDVLKGRTKILIAIRAQKFNPQSVEMFIDDKAATTSPIPIETLPSAQYNWETKDFVDGPHKLTVRVTDTQGFRGWAEVNVFINNDKKIDSLPPSLSWLNAESFQQLSGKASIQLQAVDNFGVKWIIVSVNPASDPNKKPALRSWLLNRPPYVVNFDTSKVQDGLYQMTAKAWDSFEQEGLAAPLTIGIVNNPINATTQAEMLNAMRRMSQAGPSKASTTKAPTKFTVDAPDTDTNVNASASSSPARSAAATASAPAAVAKPNVVVKTPTAAKAPLLPSAPPMVVRSTAPTQAAKSATGAAGASTLNKEINGAVNDDWKNRLAANQHVTVGDAQLSTTKSANPVGARVGAADVQATEAPRLASVRADRPAGATRQVTADASLSASEKTELNVAGRRNIESGALKMETTDLAAPHMVAPIGAARQIMGAPALSQENSSVTTRATVGVPIKVETQNETREGRLSGPETLVASAPARPIGEPVMSAPAVIKGSRIAERVAVLPPADMAPRTPSRLASPQLSPEPVPASANAQLSAPAEAPQPQASSKWPLFPKNAGAANPAAEKTRIAALPRTQRSSARNAITAISVSPLEVKTTDAIPAFHHVTRSTDLRAVAARYGLPVDVVAACNGWTADKALTVGTTVKLPKQLEVAYQGVPVRGDAPSMLVGGTGVTAFRFMFEQAGGHLQWDPKKQRVIAKKGNSEVALTIGSKTAKVGDKDVMMELAAFLFEGRTMVPVRFFEEGLNAQVEWDPQTGRLVVAMAN